MLTERAKRKLVGGHETGAIVGATDAQTQNAVLGDLVEQAGENPQGCFSGELPEVEFPADSAGTLVLDESWDEVGGFFLVRFPRAIRHGYRVHEIPEECGFRHHDFHAHVVDDDFGLARGQKHLREGARHAGICR